MDQLVKKTILLALILILFSGCRQSRRIGYQKEVPQMSFPLFIDGNTPPSGSPVPKEKTNLIRLCNPSFLGSWREGNYDYHLFIGLNAKGYPTIKLVSSIKGRKYHEQKIYVYDKDRSKGADIKLHRLGIDYKNYTLFSIHKEYTMGTSFIYKDGKLI